MLRALLPLLLACGASAAPLLFVDNSTVSSADPRLRFRLNKPTKGPRVVSPTEKWESWAVFAYNHVMRGPDGQWWMYYDCIEGTGLPPGDKLGSLSHRRICLAKSTDGLVWTKPHLGIFNLNGSTANNILLEDSGVSVFEDLNPKTPASERWKMIVSQGAYASPDGLRWTKLPFKTVAEDDTKPTAYWDSKLGKYVVSVRRDLAPPSGKSSDVVRYIGRCVTANISDWQQEAPDGCAAVFSVDRQDPDHLDLYTNAWTPYPSVQDPAVHLYFPSMYQHFSATAPYGFGNDGLLDIRLVVSRDGIDLHYTDTDNARSPFIPLGVNECGVGASSPSVKGGWCSPVTGIEKKTSFDTSAMYMASGFATSTDGSEVFFYSSGQPFTHGGDSSNQTWGDNNGIRVLRMRRDGFVSVDAPYGFYADIEAYPQLVTVNVTVPALPCPVGSSVSVFVNAETSVAGFVALELQHGGKAVEGYSLTSADPIKGNTVGARASWGAGKLHSLDGVVGQSVAFRVAMADASLYSLSFGC